MRKDTIAAISTSGGVGAIGMVRLSGAGAIEAASSVFRPRNPARVLSGLGGYSGVLGRVFDGETAIDDAVAFIYRAPHSYTGEDVVELCCHGGAFAVRKTLRLCLDAGARPAQPGEFTRRAFLAGKLDLSQAEAVMDLISAHGESAMRAALAARDGALARETERLSAKLLAESAHIAAWSDYPEEDLAPVDAAALFVSLTEIRAGIGELLSTGDRGRIIREGAATAILGKPNVGKSALMNLLAGQERSIVTEIPGTTRDIVQDTVSIGGLALNLLDTAGIRQTCDIVEREGVNRSLRQLETADLILAVFDSSGALDGSDRELLGLLAGKNCIAVLNKADLPPAIDKDEIAAAIPRLATLSAQTGEGRGQLEELVAEALNLTNLDPDAAMLANERQRACAAGAASALDDALEALAAHQTLDAVGVCIDTALDSLLAITGRRASEAVADEVFARFCVGK